MSHALVVDDKESGRRLLRAELEGTGFDVTLACDAHEALEVLSELDPSLIVTDFQMPNIDGVEFLRRVRTFSDTPIVVVTAYVSPELRTRALESGATRILDFNSELDCLAEVAHQVVTSSAQNRRPASRTSTRQREKTLRQSYVERVYLDCNGNVSETARRLKNSRGSVRYQLRKLGINV